MTKKEWEKLKRQLEEEERKWASMPEHKRRQIQLKPEVLEFLKALKGELEGGSHE